MRRFILPAVVLAVAVIASVLAANANDAADPGDPPDDTSTASLGTPLLSVRRTPEWLRAPTNSNLLDASVRNAIDSVGDAGVACVSVHVNGESVTEVASDLPLIPGEVQRLLTLAALDTVGTGTFTTEVVRDAAAVITDEGVLEGDLWLVGGADPVLSTNAYITRFGDGRAFTSLEELALTTAAALRDQGIRSVNGSIIGVDSKYDGFPQAFPDVWTAAEVASATVGVTSGLLVDNGLRSFAPTEIDPSADVRAPDAVAHAASKFLDILDALQVPVTGGATSGDAPAAVSRESVASIESPPMAEIAKRALLDGTTAEMLWRETAVRGGAPSDAPTVLGVVNVALVDLGLLASDVAGNFRKFDGSGLSVGNRARCDTLTGVLASDDAMLAVEALPDADVSPLADCDPATLDSLAVTAAARPEVTSMAGRAVASNGDVITFSAMANWFPDDTGALAPQSVCDGLLPSVLDAIAEHPAGPPIVELTPLDPVAAS